MEACGLVALLSWNWGDFIDLVHDRSDVADATLAELWPLIALPKQPGETQEMFEKILWVRGAVRKEIERRGMGLMFNAPID